MSGPEAMTSQGQELLTRFDPPQDEASLTDRLNLRRDARGFEVGSPESEEHAA